MRVLGMEKDVGAAFLTQILRDKDMAFVMSFDIGVALLQDFTSNPRRLKAALDSVTINSGGHAVLPDTPGMGGGPVPPVASRAEPCSSMRFTWHRTIEMAQQVDRKAMILLTDGEDQGSQYKIKDAVEAAQKADTIVYVLLCADRGFYGMGGYSGDSDMKKLTAETGGRVIEVGNKTEKLQAAFDQISQELRSQYGIGYVSTNPAKDGKFRKIEIKSKQGYEGPGPQRIFCGGSRVGNLKGRALSRAVWGFLRSRLQLRYCARREQRQASVPQMDSLCGHDFPAWSPYSQS